MARDDAFTLALGRTCLRIYTCIREISMREGYDFIRDVYTYELLVVRCRQRFFLYFSFFGGTPAPF